MFNKFLEKKERLLGRVNRIQEIKILGSEFINSLKRDIERNLNISVFAEFANGKSTFLNALIFKEEFLHSGIGETTFSIFNVSYGKNSTLTIDGKNIPIRHEKDIIEKIKQINSKKERLSIVDIKINNENLKGVTIIDTPGFGTFKEEILEDAFIDIVGKCDGIIFIFDISKGAKADDVTKQKKYLKSIPKDKQWIILNKLDTIRAEDKEIIKVSKDTLNELSIISKPKKLLINSYQNLYNYKTYPLSSQMALESKQGIGYDRRGNKINLTSQDIKEDLEISKFMYFEKDFLNQVPKEKYEILLNCEKKLNNEIEDTIYYLKTLIKQDKKRVDEKTLNINEIKNSKQKDIDVIQDLKYSWDILRDNFEKNKMVLKIEAKKMDNYAEIDNTIHLISQNIINNINKRLDEFGFSDIFSAKEKSQELIEKALKDSEDTISKKIEKYLNFRVKNTIASIMNIELSINNFNENNILLIEKLSSLNLDGKIVKVNEEINSKKFKNLDLSKVNGMVLDGILQPIIASIVGVIVAVIIEFIVTRLAIVFIPFIGQIIGTIVGIGMMIFGQSTSEKIKEKVMPQVKKNIPIVIKESIYTQLIEPLNRDLKNIQRQINNLMQDSEEKINAIIVASEKNQKEKEEKIKEFKVGIEKLNKEIVEINATISKIRRV